MPTVWRVSEGAAVTQYDAFVSYNHDSAELAHALQDALERFSKPWYRRHPFLRVCPDETSFGAGHDLGQRSASAGPVRPPRAAADTERGRVSVVDNEVRHFLGAKGTEHVSFVVERWRGDATRNLSAFASDGSDVPPSVHGRFAEPLAVDMRWAATAATCRSTTPVP